MVFNYVKIYLTFIEEGCRQTWASDNLNKKYTFKYTGLSKRIFFIAIRCASLNNNQRQQLNMRLNIPLLFQNFLVV